jgi:hypothetical protein
MNIGGGDSLKEFSGARDGCLRAGREWGAEMFGEGEIMDSVDFGGRNLDLVDEQAFLLRVFDVQWRLWLLHCLNQ